MRGCPRRTLNAVIRRIGVLVTMCWDGFPVNDVKSWVPKKIGKACCTAAMSNLQYLRWKQTSLYALYYLTAFLKEGENISMMLSGTINHTGISKKHAVLTLKNSIGQPLREAHRLQCVKDPDSLVLLLCTSKYAV